MIIITNVVLLIIIDSSNLHKTGTLSLCQVLLLREGTLQILTKLLDRCFVITDDGKQTPDSSATCSFNIYSWCLPIFKFIMLLFHSETSHHYPRRHDL